MKKTKSFDVHTYDRRQPVIIYGIGRYGEIAYLGLKTLGIVPIYFADRQQGIKEYMGVPLIRPEEIKNIENALVLVASKNYFHEIVENLERLEITNYRDMCSFANLEIDTTEMSEYAKDEWDFFDKYIRMVEAEGLILSHCELVLTEKCTLKCVNCSSLMPHYKEPCHVDFASMLSTFDKLLDTVDGIMELRLLGGEPFLYPQIDDVIKYYGGNVKIKKITVYTNSTVLPNADVCKVLQQYGVEVHMSDYGINRKKVDELTKLLMAENVSYHVHEYEQWYDLGKPVMHKHEPKRMRTIYANCVARACYTFYRGRLYMCPRAAHGERLGYFVNQDMEVLDVSMGTVPDNRNKLKKMLYELPCLTACMYCNGADEGTPMVPAAIQ